MAVIATREGPLEKGHTQLVSLQHALFLDEGITSEGVLDGHCKAHKSHPKASWEYTKRLDPHSLVA